MVNYRAGSEDFVMEECYFRQLTPKLASQEIDTVTITLKATSGSDVLPNYGFIITDEKSSQSVMSSRKYCMAL